ncbi:MAG TPA: alanine--tRNA ligase [Firmicutes bacterium]|nr:alanine--tRNA ligase [Bacillota bacterium]
MKWTGLNELREKYLSFFESKGHLRLPSFSLVPQNDKSLLLINSGMAPMKKYFTGEVTPPRKRVTTCQKCVRTPDIERVGKTARHGTYFEMLGNFSFGDYFKHEATAWAWEFCTKVLELPADRIWISIYQDDDEAFAIWTKEVGVPADHIVRLGKEDNFWEHGSGPCGPCSELYFDRGEKYGCGSPTCGVGCDCDRYVEFWNLVFTQFDNDGNGNYTPLDHPNIDTGMGLERLACIMQGVDNLFEVDTVQNIMKHVGRLAGVTYGQDEKTDVSLRVVTDHIRSTTFMIGDGVMPSNEGRGYVVRRLLRRAARHGRLLGIHEPFLYEVCDTVIAENRGAYPELEEKKAFIKKLIHVEEESFGKTIDSGLAVLDEMLAGLQGDTLSGADAFKLYDTYGFPIDLTKDILEEKGVAVDEEEFARLMTEQRARARAARKNAGADAWKNNAGIMAELEPGRFVGYDTLRCPAKVTAIIRDDELVDGVSEGEEAVLVLDTTPFYAESGGQVGDIGAITSEGSSFDVRDTVKSANGVILHTGGQTRGEIRVGDVVVAAVNEEERRATMRNHTAAHLLQAALREVLGSHVEQAGQLVNAKRMRFDFTHFSALAPEELTAVEALVNQWVLAALPADIREMPIDEAKKLGAMALFGEKYGDIVRVVRMGSAEDGTCVSTELCGGTHVDNTAKLGLFRIVSESSVAAGVRRIEAVTGANVLELLNEYRGLLTQAADALRVGNIDEVPHRAVQLAGELKDSQRELQALKSKMAASKVEGLFGSAKEVEGIKVVAAAFTGTGSDAVRAMCDRCRDANIPNVVAVLAGIQEDAGSVSFACYCGPEAVAKGAHAGNIVREVAKLCGGKGGGRPDSAMGGGKDLGRVDDAINAVDEILASLLAAKK